MITNRDIDRQLGSWFEARATSIAPDGLLERSLGRVRATRQRPAWVVTDRWALRGGTGYPSTRSARLMLALVALVAIAMVAAAVGGQFRGLPPVIVDPSPSPTISIAPSPGAATPGPTERPTPTPNNAFTTPAGMFAEIDGSLLASETVGWISTPAGLYRTEDTGSTWTKLRPIGSSLPAASVFIDADTMYAASGGSPATIAATHDGGRSWIDVGIDVGAFSAGPIFSFQTAQIVFATFLDPNDSRPNASQTFHVYGTTDGGATWTGPEDGKVPHMAESMDKLNGPIAGFLYQSAGKADNKPFDNRFFLSADGGVTWTQYTFPINGLAPKGDMKDIRALVREDNGRIIFAIDADNGRTSFPVTIYESGDDTATWRLVQTLPTGGVNIQLLSPTTWIDFSTAPSQVRSTVDGGAHWRITTPATSLYYMGAQFATPDTGWGTQDCHASWGPVGLCDGKIDDPVMGVTKDGGATWTRLGP